MMKTRWYIFVLLLMLTHAVNAATSALEKNQVISFMRKMYSYSMNMFEAAEFQGKYAPDKQCALMEEFFSKDLILRKEKRQGCDVGDVFIRYPGFSGADFDIYGGPGEMPKYKLGIPNIEEGKASISVKIEFGSVLFFLIQTEKGLRVENALYDEWPLIKDGKCRSDFLKSPSGWQKKKAPLVCQ